MAALLNEQVQTGGVVIRRQDHHVIREVAVGGLEFDGTEAEVLIPLGASVLLQAILLRIRPGGSSNGNRQHDGEEVGLVTSGELLLTVSGNEDHLKAGDSFFYKSNEPHGFRNPGPETAMVVWVNTPATV